MGHSSRWGAFDILVLEVCDVRLTPLVGHGIVLAPLGGDPAEVTAGVLALSVVTHAGRWCMSDVSEGKECVGSV